LRPILDAYLDAYQTVSARLALLDKPVSLIDEGIDIALRVGHLADSTLVAIRVGEVRRVVLAAPGHLARHKRIETPSDLTKHNIIAFAPLGADSWSFLPLPSSSIPQTVQFTPRSLIDSAEGRSKRRWTGMVSHAHSLVRLPSMCAKDGSKLSLPTMNIRMCPCM
jgi:DNA-binding transcriptional LysR family regulator